MENILRADLHPLDQYRAIKQLVDLGLDDHEEIAGRLLLTAAIVKQRLKLAKVSPKILELFEKGEIKYEHLIAFTVSDDHARQEQVWEIASRSHSPDAFTIKRLLTETAVRGDDRRAVYVGAEAYEAAGGVIVPDLFAKDWGGYYQDAPLLEQLVFDKLKVDAQAIQAEGWKWVDAAISLRYGHASGMRRIYGEPRDLTADELARHDAVKAEYDKLDAEYAKAEDYDEEIEDKLEELREQLNALSVRPEVYSPEQIEIAGVFITLGADGHIEIERGFVRPEDEPQVDDDYDNEHDGETVNSHDHGGGGVVVNGKPVEETEDESEDAGIRPLSGSLIYDLTAQRTLALRNALASDVDVAFVAALHAFILQIFYQASSNSCLEVKLTTSNLPLAKGLGETPWAKEIAERHQGWGRDLPPEKADLWEFLLQLDEASRKALFAHCVSLSLNAVNEKWNRRPQAIAHADAVADTLQFDMVSAGWVPTVDNYLGKVTRHESEAVREARGEEAAQLIDHLKKDRMALEAARLLDGSNWLPELLRGLEDVAAAPDPEQEPDTQPDGDAADLPAFLAESAQDAEEGLQAAE